MRITARACEWNRPVEYRVVIGLLCCLITILSMTAPPASAQTNGKIVYAPERDGNREIYVMNPDGTSVTRLTNNTATEYTPVWSPDGSRILFTSDRSGDFDVYVMNPDGSGVTNLTNHTAREYCPTWSPDGSRILFSSDRNHPGNSTEIFAMDADGTNLTQLTSHANIVQLSENCARYSPDQSRIAFWSDKDQNGTWDIYVMNADGTGVTQLYPNGVDDYEPRWSADGSQLLFWSGSGGIHDVFLINADGTGLVNLTSHAADDAHAAFSPDGTQIVFASNRSGIHRICFMSSTGGTVTCSTEDGIWPDWQAVAPGPRAVSIDIKPASFPNSVNPNSNGVIPVAILTTGDFDALSVDVAYVRFGPAFASEAHGGGHVEDVDGDGDLDLVFHFRTQHTGIACGDTSATLVGQTVASEAIQGADSVKTVGCQ